MLNSLSMGSEQSRPALQEGPTLSNISNKLSSYNWIPSYQVLKTQISCPADQDTPLEEYFDLRRNMPQMGQENTDYCQVSKAIAVLINYCLLQSKSLHTFPPSYHYLLYLLKNVAGTSQLHSFGHLSEIIRNFGICSHDDFLNYQERPSDETFRLARPFRHIKFMTVPVVLDNIKRLLANETPLLLGMPVYSNFLKTETEPRLTLSNNDDILLGGFCGLIVGYQETDRHFIVMTTKGKRWGDRGYIFIPYQQIIDSGAEIVKIDFISELIKLDLDKSNQLSQINYPSRQMNQVSNEYQTSHQEGTSFKTIF